MRVHTLAKELGVSTQRLISFLQSQGFDIKGALNTLGDEEVSTARAKLGGKTAEPQVKKPAPVMTGGTKKKVFIRTKQPTDPRASRIPPRPTSQQQQQQQQQLRPVQIPPKRPGMTPKIAATVKPKPRPQIEQPSVKPEIEERPVEQVQPPVREPEVASHAAEAAPVAAQPETSPVQAETKPVETKPEARTQPVARTDQRPQVRDDRGGPPRDRQQQQQQQQQQQAPGGTRPPKYKYRGKPPWQKGKDTQVKQRPDDRQRPGGPERPKFSREDAIRAARDKRRGPTQQMPRSQHGHGEQPSGPVSGMDALGIQKPQPMPADLRRKKKKPRPDFKQLPPRKEKWTEPEAGAVVTKPKGRKPEKGKDVVLEGKALDIGISRLKGGFKTSVDVGKLGKTKRRKKILPEKKRFKPAGGKPPVKEKDVSQYGGRGVLVKKHRKRRKDEIPDLVQAGNTVDTQKKIRITDHMTIKDLSSITGVRSPAIMKYLLNELNVMATINQVVDIDMIAMILEHLGLEYEIAVKHVEDVLKHDVDTEEDLVRRPPVVTVLGHVDHGKTRLLDTIRRTNVAGGEAGGITQAIGAYQVNVNGRAITFLDTPGHEAFTAMRARGAKVTDVAILVVACDDGVQPQTVEAVDHAKSAGLEIIVALNKVDLQTSDPDRVKGQLAELGLIPEEWGGKTVMVPISAKFGQGIDELLELVLLQADILDLKSNPKAPAEGTIIEAKIDKGKGALATVLIQRGTLRVGDYVVAGCSFGRIRAMLNENGKNVTEAGPSTPVEIFGMSDVPQAGDTLNQVKNEKTAKEIYDQRCLNRRQESIRAVNKISLEELYAKIKEGETKDLNLIIKADMQGSIEAIIHALGKIQNPEVQIKFIHSSVGNVRESDIYLAIASKSIIIAFNVVVSAEMKKMATMEGIDIRSYNIIYKAVEDVELAMKGMLEPQFEEKISGTAEVRAIFKKAKGMIIAGLIVTSGKLVRNGQIRIMRKGEKIWDGKLTSLKRFQDDAREVENGMECGVQFESITDLEEGDIIEEFAMVEVPR